MVVKELDRLLNAWLAQGKPTSLRLSTLIDNSADTAKSPISQRACVMLLQKWRPSSTLIQILQMDLSLFQSFGLPINFIILLQPKLRDIASRLATATGLKGPALEMLVVKSGKVDSLNHVVDLVQGRTQGGALIREHFMNAVRVPAEVLALAFFFPLS